MKSEMRRFYLQRDEDHSGVSGTGAVAEGVVFTTGYVAITWLSHLHCTATYHSIDVMMKIHGHGGKTRVVFIDPEPGDTTSTESTGHDGPG
jgi:hypothetical protein